MSRKQRLMMTTLALSSFSLLLLLVSWAGFSSQARAEGGGGVAIRDIQGAAHTSPLDGQMVAGVHGIVTAIDEGDGFYMQDPNPDENDATSEGIFVVSENTDAVTVGDEVLLSGTVNERGFGSELTTTRIELTGTVTISSTGNSLPAAIVIGEGGRMPPNQVIDDDSLSSFDANTDGIDFYESLEGMRIQVNNALAVGPTSRFGEIPVVSDNGTNAGPFTPNGGLIISTDDFNPERIIFDDGIVRSEPAVNTGDRFSDSLTGVVGYSFSNFKILNTEPLPAVTSGGLMSETTSLTGTANKLTISSFNVENLDGEDSAEKFAAVASVIANNLQAPDIIALQEIQDNNGSTDDGTVDASETYNTLIAAITAAGGPTYEFRDIAPQDKVDGGQPGANIRVGFLFNPARVSFVDRAGGDASSAVSAVMGDAGVELSFSPGRIDPTNDAFEESRKPLAGEFIFDNQKVIVINGHFNSKSGDNGLFAGVQPPVLGSETQRLLQAGVVNSFVDQILAVDADAKVIVLGDLNDFEFSSPLTTLADDVLVNLINTLPNNERYSYIFDGNSQTLDHILLSHNLFNYGAEFDVVHSNADFAARNRGSDHDALIARVALERPSAIRFASFNASLNRNNAGDLISDLSTPDNDQAKVIAEIIQRNNPDVLLINEFDYNEGQPQQAAQLFQQNYLAISQNGAPALNYAHYYVAPSNTGVPSGFDLDNNGATDEANDAYGFGFFPGQYGMVVYSKYPIATEQIRTFQNFLWKDMPNALLPVDPATGDGWYTDEELAVVRLSSKSHWDIPVNVNGKMIHVLASHPTPPVFDGDEDRNGRRNHDEIRFWADYVTAGRGGDYIYDDAGTMGGLAAGESFVIMGDQNADPSDGDSTNNPIMLLLNHARVNTTMTPSSAGGPEQSQLQGEANDAHQGDPAFDTADFSDGSTGNLRADYVLPSSDLTMNQASVFWPLASDPLFERLVGTFPFPGSDHRLVSVDIADPAGDPTAVTLSDINSQAAPTPLWAMAALMSVLVLGVMRQWHRREE